MSAEAFRAVREMRERAYERRERSRLFVRLKSIIASCYRCGRVQDPGQKFEDRIDGWICPNCIDGEANGDD